MTKRSKTMKKSKRAKTRSVRRQLKGGWKISPRKKSAKKTPVKETLS